MRRKNYIHRLPLCYLAKLINNLRQVPVTGHRVRLDAVGYLRIVRSQRKLPSRPGYAAFGVYYNGTPYQAGFSCRKKTDERTRGVATWIRRNLGLAYFIAVYPVSYTHLRAHET